VIPLRGLKAIHVVDPHPIEDLVQQRPALPLILVAAFVNDSLFYAFVAVARLGVCLISRRSLSRRPS
jgi:hypothetical protein